jgi:hypothetical protein
MATSQFRPFFQIISIGLKTNTNILVKTVCTRRAAEQTVDALSKTPLHYLVEYKIIERPRTSPFEICDECPSRKTPVSMNSKYHV